MERLTPVVLNPADDRAREVAADSLLQLGHAWAEFIAAPLASPTWNFVATVAYEPSPRSYAS